MGKNDNHIYIFKCVVGAHNDICKIGRTEDIDGRLKQHSRTPYYGFIPYCDFTTGKVIATDFEVVNASVAEKLVQEQFKSHRLSKLEIYNVDYDDAIEEIYTLLKANNQFVKLEEDGISAYDFLNKTKKTNFEKIKNQLLSKYGNNLPDELLLLLRDKKSFEEDCVSHFKSGNFIDFNNGMVLDLHYNKAKRKEIMSKLRSLLQKAK